MDYEIITLEEKIAVGVSARTNNLSPDMGTVIGGLWNRFYQEGIYASIPHKANEKALGIYTDYDGDEKADYRVVVACETEKEPEEGDYTVIKIPAGRYARFIIYGDMVQAVGAAWQEIWNMNLPRSFQCDFEEYQDDSMDGHAQIHIYVGLKDEAEEKGKGNPPASQYSCCGADCGKCQYLGSLCGGCTATSGKVFHAPEGKACPIYACSVEEKRFASCGDCKEIPCSIWKSTKDPRLSQAEFEADIERRIHNLKNEKR